MGQKEARFSFRQNIFPTRKVICLPLIPLQQGESSAQTSAVELSVASEERVGSSSREASPQSEDKKIIEYMSKYSDLLVLRISEFDMNRIHHLEVLPTYNM